MSALLEAIGEDLILNRIAGGESQGEIADSLAVDAGDLSRWLNKDPQRSARAREARTNSAESWIDRGLRAITAVNTSSRTAQAEISKARELAIYCGKIAKIRNPREYGDKIDVSGSIDHKHSVSELFKQIVSTPSLVGCIVPDEPEDAVLIPHDPKS